MNSNPFIDIPYFPAFDQMTPEGADAAFERLLPETTEAVNQLEASFTPTWEGLVRPLDEICRPLHEAWGFFHHLKSVVDNDGWRTVEEKYLPQVIAFSQRIAQSKAFYEGYLQLEAADRAHPCLNAIQRRILAQMIRDMKYSGVGLPDEEQKHFNELTLQQAQTSQNFSNHVLDATKAFSLLLTQPEEVAGLSDSLLAITAQAAAGEGETADPKKGPWKITLDAAVRFPFMKNAENRSARETVCRASAVRASSGELDNTPLIEERLKLSRESANMIGFNTYADLKLSTKMAGSVEAVDRLIADLQKAALPFAKRENQDLLAFAKRNGFAEERLQVWDVAYWSERQREALYDYNEEELSHYFPFPHVLKGLFALSERLFGIVISEATGEVPVWHKDVRFFHVKDSDGTPIAHFYLDPYSRPETKRGGAWMNEFRTRERKADGSLVLPIAVLVCNQSVPIGDKPALMRFGEVNTLFHEFGHSLQHMLTTVDEPAASGINGVEWDAVEIASQFMENWCYDRDTVRAISAHDETGESLPDDLFDKLVAAKNYRSGNAMIRQLFFAATDMDLYARYPRPEWPDADAVKKANEKRFEIDPVLDEDRFLCSFSHIFAGAYSAGYYGYKWSEVLSADVFAAFEEAGLDNEEAVRKTGRRYRDTILALGGGTHPSEVFRLFRGRDPSIEPLLRQTGLQ